MASEWECSSTLPMPKGLPRARCTVWHPWPADSWELNTLLCCGPREDWAARFASLGKVIDELELDTVGQAFNLACLFEDEAWSLGVWDEHTRIYEWVQKQSPSFMEELLKQKVVRLREFQREMEVREGELAELFREYPEG